jgi:hypothetical protein
MKCLLNARLTFLLVFLSSILFAQFCAISLSGAETLNTEWVMSREGKACITCQQQTMPGLVADWKQLPRTCRNILY